MSGVATILKPSILTMYFDNKPIRYFMHNEVLHVCGLDVTKAFEYKDPSNALATMTEKTDQVVCQVQNSRGQLRSTIFLIEAAFYELAFRSNLPAAKQFTRKVTSEILPAIRKTGRYENESVKSIMQSTPRPWELMYPIDFRKIIPKTGMSEAEFYKFIYNNLLPDGTYDAMKSRTVSKPSGMRRDNYDRETNERVRLHQYFNENGRDLNVLITRGKLSVIIQHMLPANSNRNEFMRICNTVFGTKSITAK